MHAVSVRVMADGLDITVQGGSFEDAKRNMQLALNEYVQSLVRKPYVIQHKSAA